MRLTDPWFEAQFIGKLSPDGNSFHRQGSSLEGAQGLFMYSPCGYGKDEGSHCLIVWFANPRGAEPAHPSLSPTYRWQVSGTCLDDLTLSPSVNLAVGPGYPEHNLKPGECRPGRMCWHGWIRNGEVT